MPQMEEKMHKVLLGFSASPEPFINIFTTDMSKNNVVIKECEMRYSKIAIKQYVNDNPDTDVIIVMEYLEKSKPFTVVDFMEIHERYENIKIIVILENNKKSTNYMKELLNIGVFNALFADDASYENIATLIKQGRTRKEARIYYGTSDTLSDSTSADIEQCIQHIQRSRSNEELKNNTLYIKEAVSEREFTMILQGISEEARGILKQFEEFSLYFDEDSPSKKANSSGKALLTKGSLINITRPSKKEVIEKVVVEKVIVQQKINLNEIINNTIVGFTGIKARVGNTHQLLTAAFFLNKNSYKVAVVELFNFANSTFNEIKDYFNIEGSDTVFSYNGVDFYSNYKLEELNLLINGKYNFILIDYGIYQEKMRTEFERCSIQVITACYSEWEKKSIESFIDKISKTNIGVNYNYLIQNVPTELYASFQQQYTDSINVYFSEVGSPFSENGNSGIKQIFKGYINKDYDDDDVKKKKNILLPFLKRKNNKENIKVKNKTNPLRTESNPKKRKIEFRGKGVAFITSLKPGVGCTYFSIASSNYINNEDMGSVCLITDNKAAVDTLNKSVDCVYKNKSIEESYLSYDFIVIDKGPLNELKEEDLKELRRADFKIMLCDADDTYLSNLSNFIRSLGPQANGWCYVFNRLTKTKEKEVSKLMINYQTYFLSTFEMSELRKKDVNRVFDDIYQKGAN